jgi:magnesium and cobalt transporter
MSDDYPSSNSNEKNERSWLNKIIHAFSAEPKSRDELLEIIKDAAENHLLDPEAVSIIEGAMDVSTLHARELMVPRSQIVALRLNSTPTEILEQIIESGHSRYPVVGESMDDVYGILLVKDLLPVVLAGTENFSIEPILRSANIVPEGKRVNVLLREFREDRYHMALVMDEFGSISGLITIEDILEEIVGDIEDETDIEDEVTDLIKQVSDTDYIIKALAPIEDINAYFGFNLSEEDFDTLGGILMQAFGHLPKRNEEVEMGQLRFRVLYADNRQIHLVRLTLLPQE